MEDGEREYELLIEREQIEESSYMINLTTVIKQMYNALERVLPQHHLSIIFKTVYDHISTILDANFSTVKISNQSNARL